NWSSDVCSSDILSERTNASRKSTGPPELETLVTVWPPQSSFPHVNPLIVKPSFGLIVPFSNPTAAVIVFITDPGAYVAAKRLTNGSNGSFMSAYQFA